MENEKMAEVKLISWIREHSIKDEMRWKGAAGNQLAFVQYGLLPVFCSGMYFDEFENAVTVISTHRSKSIELPVYKMTRPGVTVVARNNFYNWKFSVVSDKRIDCDFSGLFHTDPPVAPDYTGNELASCYFEGFPHEYIFGYYDESDKKKFSANIGGDHAAWAVLYLIMRDLGLVKPHTWHTPESHRAELDSLRVRRTARELLER